MVELCITPYPMAYFDEAKGRSKCESVGILMKFTNKKQIQKLYRMQMQEKKEQEIIFVEMIIIMVIAGIAIAISTYIG